eukprot:scaffold8065_cov267-Pinguiococcus_pyrenoidosus.AAC.7
MNSFEHLTDCPGTSFGADAARWNPEEHCGRFRAELCSLYRSKYIEQFHAATKTGIDKTQSPLRTLKPLFLCATNI